MVKNKYEAVIFDLDGTLLDTSEGILSAVKYTIDQFGFSQLTDKQLHSFIGPPIQDSFAKAYNLNEDILQDIATVFRNRYKDYDLCRAVPYEGIYDTLNQIRKFGIKTAVATYKREDYALILLNHFGFDKYFDIMHGGDHFNVLKKSDIINMCITELGITDNANVVLVGDTTGDELGAQKSGIDFIGVTYGFGYQNDESRKNAKAIGFAQNPYEIINYINS